MLIVYKDGTSVLKGGPRFTELQAMLKGEVQAYMYTGKEYLQAMVEERNGKIELAGWEPAPGLEEKRREELQKDSR